MPKSTFVDILPEEQRQMLAVLRRARYGYLLALHILLLCAHGRNHAWRREAVWSRVWGYCPAHAGCLFGDLRCSSEEPGRRSPAELALPFPRPYSSAPSGRRG